ncbi:OmpP1/FadL family transporter [Coraliomargarita parva]|uniref:OmpP1/FadL family transporter n=1 Tax=Coraliomargarita parva TaxID=3014050 RepID=UPI0022B5659E|nr:outer membrane protein transport protein [Coraliomargarita parva]
MRQTTTLISLASSFLAIQAMEAAATRIAFVDSFATARGNAFTATADNPSAVFYNAAGLTQLEGTELQAQAFAISLAYEYDGASGKEKMDDEFQPVPSFFVAHKFEDRPLAIGFGSYAPFALGSDWGSDAAFANPLLGGGAVPYEAELTYVKYHAVFAWQVSDTLSVAAGASFDDSEIDVKSFGLRFNGDDRAAGYSLSVLWKPNEQHAFGLNYQAKTDISYSGTAKVFIQNELFAGYVPVDTTADLIFPESIVFGYAYTPNEKWNFEFNLDWTNWDRVNKLKLDDIPGAAYNLNWESSFIWELGATRFFDNGWHLSAGYTYVENAVPDQEFLPIVPDSDRHFFALGVGGEVGQFTWQLTYQYAIASDRSVDNAEVHPFGAVDGDWDLDSQAVAFSLNYSF